MVGTGEYTTGYVGAVGGASKSDKGSGVVGLTLIDLRARTGIVGRLVLVGVRGGKLAAIKDHMKSAIADRYPASEYDMSMDTFPAPEATDPSAYLEAFKTMPRGSAVTIFTPDDTHFEIALAAVNAGLHVLIAKPLVKSLKEHLELLAAAHANNVLCVVEVHKRFDPFYTDARDRIASLGDFSYMAAYMSQPKMQLTTFASWLGSGASDISYYLNAHHIDLLEWCLEGKARPVLVFGSGSTGVAKALTGADVEDTITLTVHWENLASGTQGVAVFTSSWIAPKSDVHSQQRFFYMGHKGEVNVDQAHRGFSTSTDEAGYASPNPLFMKYVPQRGRFAGQLGYGYRSIEAFVRAVQDVNAGVASVSSFDATLPTVGTTLQTTAILEAGRKSLDLRRPVRIVYSDSEGHKSFHPVALD